ncbi:lipid-A-disaccharide synthase [Flammeovirga kamogawensis]|uniref:Lipid-A-disaccharide synthase n=1 Tax=Flammeovirga kamogawensis TaxID=373891 RepID=A0ABX8GX04_9BACT|nr:lipid-A-disaccharide synthase [Flammeovirga kamogawensis]MBB6461611.1 lipid-A-disaccharide synthase [Flammeovirga kamogawensis]QWG07460.1 lipid-A-disaccharide synthase [Flammeovirga kamogawensis]TRX69272.1 lipid-A-disaccharide synthase [Flammeovirga kamogawensis]
MKYYLIAGEKSGDLHASNLMKEILVKDPDAEFRFWGGEEMQKVGGTMIHHYADISFMGFLEVAKNLVPIYRYLNECKKDILCWKPDVVILVDFSGFNLKIAKYVKPRGTKVFYYISPKVWAWNQNRAKRIRKVVDRMFVIMHFEKAFYKKFDYDVDYVGNPLFDAIKQFTPSPSFFTDNNINPDKKIIAILPGSRFQEVSAIMNTMLTIIPKYSNEYQFIIAGVENLPANLYDEAKALGVKVIFNQTYDLLTHATSAVVTSGTATLETALFDVPQVVCYRTSTVTYSIVKALIKVKFISLVNLIADKEVVKELIQKDFTTERLEEELEYTLTTKREKILSDYAEMKAKIDTEGTSKKAANLMYKYLTEGVPEQKF